MDRGSFMYKRLQDPKNLTISLPNPLPLALVMDLREISRPVPFLQCG